VSVDCTRSIWQGVLVFVSFEKSFLLVVGSGLLVD